MRVVVEAEGVDGIFAYGMNVEGTICLDGEGVFVFIGLKG